MSQFEEFKLSNELVQNIEKQGITKPTLIQKQTIPLIIKGKDIIGESATGSGKTIAFGCGIIERTLQGKGVQALVLTPTRELAEQVKEAIKKLSQKLRIIAVYGGISINPQIDELRRAEVVVATPGRLLDHMTRRTIDMSRIITLVLDEADRMLDMGFIDDVEKIIKECPKNRQTLFFSATISPDIKELAYRYMDNPVKITGQKMVDPKKLRQIYYNVTGKMKFSLLVHLLKNEDRGLVMIFCNTRKNVNFIEKNLKANNIGAIAIHGGLTQNKRSNTIETFNKGKISVLVCTDVAARGLHISNVSHIYNYDIPKDPKEYVHRIGRTARAGEEGIVINLLSEYDYDNFSRIYNDPDFNIKKMDKPYTERVVMMQQQKGRYQKRRRNYR